MWNLREIKTDEHRGKEGKINKMKIEREAKRLLTIRNKLRVAGGEVHDGRRDNLVMSIKEGT